MAVTGTIIAALIAAGTSIWAGYESNQATEEANKTNLGLAGMQRQDTLSANAANLKLSKDTLALQKKQQKFNEKQTGLEFQNKLDIQDYNKQQNAVARGRELINAQLAQDQNLNAIFRGRK